MESIDRLEELYLKKLDGTATPEELDEFDLLSTGDPAPTTTPRPSKKAKYVQSLQELANVIGIAKRNLQTWKSRAGFPAKTAKGYNVEKVRQFIAANRNDNAHREQSPEEKQEKVLLLRARRLQAELKLEEQRGQLVPAAAAAETVATLYAQQNAYFERMLESEPPKIAKLGGVEEIREHLRTLINDLIAQQREYLRQENEKLQRPAP